MNAGAPRLDPDRDLVAYLCAEYGMDERLPLYAGGLGVLAGDHLKSAADLGVPLVAVGLLYREGYFRQRLDTHGQQHAESDHFDPAGQGLAPVQSALGQELRVSVPLADHVLQLKVWRAAVGEVPLFLLDSACAENLAEDRRITARLYGGDHDARLLQEIVLGIGGVRALRALGLQPTVWHLNEGHAALASLERIRELVANGLSFGTSLEVIAANTVFTTHTPLPAGHDVFNHRQIRHWLGDYLGSLHAIERKLLALGADGAGAHRFSMTALALRASRFHNAVSRVHRDVAARMEAHVWPRVPAEENPVRFVANAVHLPTFLTPEWAACFDERRPGWSKRALTEEDCAWIAEMSDPEFDGIRLAAKRRLLSELRRRLGEQHGRNGLPAEIAARALMLLDPAGAEPLVMCFARRFATYKRATLLLSDPSRLASLLHQDERPVLLVFAGKAHPHDDGGQQLLRTLHEHSLRPQFLGRLVVVEGYDLALARALVQGCDVWLNWPEYPLEASGTSGMKAAVNGGVNLSILDGWWADACDGSNGIGIIPRTDIADRGARDALEAGLIFDALERCVVPIYFQDRAGWRRMSRRAMQTLIPRYGGARMLEDYVRDFYAPAARHGQRLRERHCRNAVEFKRWKKMIQESGEGVRPEITGREPLRVRVRLNGLAAKEIDVELRGPEGTRRLALQEETRDGADYVLSGTAPAAGAIRVVPVHPLLAHPYDLGFLAVVEFA